LPFAPKKESAFPATPERSTRFTEFHVLAQFPHPVLRSFLGAALPSRFLISPAPYNMSDWPISSIRLSLLSNFFRLLRMSSSWPFDKTAVPFVVFGWPYGRVNGCGYEGQALLLGWTLTDAVLVALWLRGNRIGIV